MMINDENKKSVKKMLSGRALYIALGVCVLAAGIVGYSVVNNTKTPSSIETTTEKQTYINVNEPQTGKEEESSLMFMEEPTSVILETTAQEPTEAVFDNANDALESETEQVVISYSLPLNKGISLDYSMGIPVYSSTMSDYRTHNGVDFTAAAGESVGCVAGGTVISVTKDESWGNTVQIDHGGGIVSSVSGLADEGIVSEGITVESGDIIGVAGIIPIEEKDGEHIHLEIRVNGILTDPLELMGYSTEPND